MKDYRIIFERVEKQIIGCGSAPAIWIAENLMYAILQYWCYAIDIYLMHMVNWSCDRPIRSCVSTEQRLQAQISQRCRSTCKYACDNYGQMVKIVNKFWTNATFSRTDKRGTLSTFNLFTKFIYWLVVYCYTSHSKIFHWYGDITISC